MIQANRSIWRTRKSKFLRQSLSVLLAVLLMVTTAPIFPNAIREAAAADELRGSVVQPVLAVSGQGILGDSVYSADNVGLEKSYTLEELQSLEEITQLYSAINTTPTKSIFLGKGISIEKLLQEANLSVEQAGTYEIDIVASDGYTVKFDPAKTGDSATRGKPLKTPAFNVDRYYFPNLKELSTSLDDSGDYVYSNQEAAAASAELAKTILAWERGGERGYPEIVPDATDPLDAGDEPLLLMVGQQNVWEMNNPLFNKTVNKVIVGEAITENAITIDGVPKTRSDILMLARADRSYTYSTSGGERTDYVRGVPLAVLLEKYGENDTVSFTSADNYPAGGFSLKVGELINGNYLLGYEKGTGSDDLNGIYDTAKSDPAIYGFFTLYGDGDKPAKMINSITVTPDSGIDFVNSPYKHITNGGISGQDGPFDIDAITGATLTIEGPGVITSVPLPIRELEEQNAGAFRGTYTDWRGESSTEWTMQYEGIKLSHIVNGMTSGANGIHLTDAASKVLLKNRVRQTIAEFTLAEIEEADATEKPVIIAYGTGTTDDATTAPFVYDLAAGIKDALDNDDGPIKLVYDKTVFDADPNPQYTEFGNVAYIYVAEESSPGYKHNTPPYDTPENSQYVLTVTGDEIGREVNYTVNELEAMVTYGDDGTPVADGMGYRAEYSLANSTYWYVNEYEGVQLWKLLQKSGLPASAAEGPQKSTLVSFSATDNYKDFDKFTIEQVSNPDLFGYYEKNPEDLNDGNYKGVPDDLRSTGYPVLVAYGVNAYPYVIRNTLDGYMSGLSNDGGPLRVISGKLEYSHANGSKQAKLLDKIIVGTDNYYSTHKYNPNLDGLYQQLANDSLLNVKVISGASGDGAVLKDLTYKVGDLEELIYGGSLTNTQLKEAKIKGFYEIYKNGTFYNDLYEGLNLGYFLEQVVQLPGYKGTITFSDGTNNLELGLEEVLAYSGSNGTTELDGLAPVIAYAKNGAPMVNSKEEADGYEGTVTLAAGTPYEHTITVKNNGGPLAVIFPRLTSDAPTAASLNSVTSITINLSADNYAHTELPYSSLADNTITVSGPGTRLTAPKAFTVADIEGKQTLAVTNDYNVKKSTDSQAQTRYRGIPLYAFLDSTDVGLKPNADKVIVTCSDSSSYEFSLAEVIKSNYINGQNPTINNLQMILAYGSAAVTNPDLEDGKPLVQEKTPEAGYDEAYGNSGGPIRLVVGQLDADDINSGKNLKDVTSIEVTASDMVSWNHSSSAIYQQYLDYTFQLQVVDNNNNQLFSKTYTLAELEAMTSLIERENITWIGTQEWEGINLWDFVLQEAGTIPGVANPTSVTAFAGDGFSKELRSIFALDGLENGIPDGTRRVPIIIGYAVSGYPLVPSNTSPGYTFAADNGYGPLRLMTHLNQGACLKNTVKLVVKAGSGGSDPLPTEKDFNIYGLESGTISLDIKAIKNITAGAGGKVVKTYNWFGDHDGDSSTDKQAASDMVKGAYLADLLSAAGVTGSNLKIDITTTDGYAPDHYKGITLSEIQDKDYFVAYDKSSDNGATWTGFSDADKNSPPNVATVRIYRNYDDGSSTWYNRLTSVKGVTVTGAGSVEPTVFAVYPADASPGNLPLAGIRSVWLDDDDGLWVSTYGGGVGYKAADANTFTIYNKASSPALETAVVSAVAVDAKGGVWMTQNASYTDPSGNQGVAYLKDGQLKYYKETDIPATIPNNYVQEIQIDRNGKVWFGSFGGLTKYDPVSGEWTTWDQTYTDRDGDRFPAQSIDNLIFDGDGGVWMGFYPTGAGTEADPFIGGFAHMTAAGDITPYQFTADYDADLGSGLVAQVWVRDIAVDASGGAWVVASGSYSDLANVGGTVWYVNDQGQATKFTGDQLLGSGALTGNTEIRMVTVDPDGGLWFGTSGDGVFYIAEPSTAVPLAITAQYSGSTGSWSASPVWNNIYSLDFAGSTLYVGSSAGLAYKTFEFENTPSDPGHGGGGGTDEYDLMISGAGASKTAKFSISELKNAKGLEIVTNSYDWLNSFGTTGSDTFEGVYLENLLQDVVGLNSKAKSVTVTASDGYYREFNLDSDPLGVYWTDIQGHKMMLAWKHNGTACELKLVVGQKAKDHVNKPLWVSDIEKITVSATSTSSGSGSPGNYEKPKTEPKAETETGSKTTSVSAVVNVTPTVTGGIAKATIPADAVNTALEEINRTQPAAGTALKGVLDIIAVSSGTNLDVNQTQVILSADVLAALVKAGNVTAKIKTDLGVMVLSPEILQSLNSGNKESVTFTITKVDETELSEGLKTRIGSRPVVDLTIAKGSQVITSFDGNQLKVGIPYSAQATENLGQLLVYYLNDQGEGIPVNLAVYDQKEQLMLFETVHLSRYAVGYNEVSFRDIQDHWAKNQIEFLAAREIVKGKAAGVFEPDAKVTRAEFVTMLANTMPGAAVSGSGSAGFADVLAGAWYEDYVNWAVAMGIVNGYGDGKFGPNDLITREQMSVMLDKFIGASQKQIEVVNEKSSFKDQNNISDWAAAAITRMQQAGIINGRPDGTFDPKGNASRAEAATVIKGYIEAGLK